MAWSKSSKESILKADGKFVKIYSSATSFSIVNVGELVEDAKWVGDSLVVYLLDGKIRKYSSQTSYTVMS